VNRDPADVTDAGKLQDALRNLVENAVNYSPPDSRIRLEAGAAASERVEITVADEGPGIPESDLLRIFGGERIQNLMLRLGMEEDVPIESKLITKRIAKAQEALKVARGVFDRVQTCAAAIRDQNEQRDLDRPSWSRSRPMSASSLTSTVIPTKRTSGRASFTLRLSRPRSPALFLHQPV
jgi:light-regulated signal transduction histidine kinase (bacteriophytochrome)